MEHPSDLGLDFSQPPAGGPRPLGWPRGGRGGGFVFGAGFVVDVAGRDGFEEAERGERCEVQGEDG